MSQKPARPLPGPLLVYIRGVVAIGVLVLLHSVVGLGSTPNLAECALFAGLAWLTGWFAITVTSVPASIAVADTFFLTIAVFFGPAPATLTVAVDSFLMSWRKRHTVHRIVFNTTAPAISLWVASQAFFLVTRTPPLVAGSTSVTALPIPLLGLAAAYYVLNSSMTAAAVGFETNQSPLSVWRRHFLWLSVNYMAAGSAAFCLMLLMQQIGASAVLIIAPVLAVFHLTLRASFGRVEDARRHLGDMDRLYLSTVETLAMAIDAKDDVTHSHVRRVQAYAIGLARELGVSDEPTLKAIQAAALLHDTGKLAIPEHILNKPGKLNEAEFETMKLHVDVGADILSLVDFPYPVVPIVRCHHECWDGSGYPRGVAGEDIPIGARILSVVDCFDALTSDRPYRPAMSSEAAFEILRGRSGTMYDPRVVEAFIRVQPGIAPKDPEPSQHHDVLDRISKTRRAAAANPEQGPAAAGVAASEDVLAFVSLSRLASGENTIPDVLSLASNLLRGVAADATAVWYIADPLRNELVAMHASGPAAGSFRNGVAMPIGTRVTGWVAANRQPIVNADPLLDLAGLVVLDPPAQSCMSVPLTNGHVLVGVLTLYAARPKAFDDDRGRLIQMIAPHVAQTLARSRRQAAEATDSRANLRLVSTR